MELQRVRHDLVTEKQQHKNFCYKRKEKTLMLGKIEGRRRRG